MLDGSCPTGTRVRSHRSPTIATQVATEAWQVQGYYQLRHRVFVEEQQLFACTDHDAMDAAALPIVATSWLCGMPDRVVGAVRIYPEKSGLWYGGRLAVDVDYRPQGVIGESLIRVAVCTAHYLGATRFLAIVQPRVRRYFERFHFRVIDETLLCGITHCIMQAELDAYPACADGLQFASHGLSAPAGKTGPQQVRSC